MVASASRANRTSHQAEGHDHPRPPGELNARERLAVLRWWALPRRVVLATGELFDHPLARPATGSKSDTGQVIETLNVGRRGSGTPSRMIATLTWKCGT